MTLPLTPAPRRRRKGDEAAHRVEMAGTTTAGVVGSGFGAAKLRDTHREQYPARHTEGVRRAVGVARGHGASPQQAARMAHLLHGGGKVLHGHSGKPGFKAIAAAGAAGAVATGAHHYQELSHWTRERKQGLMKAEPRRAPTPIGHQLKVPVHNAKHAARPYMGRRRAETRLSRVKATAVMHGPKLVRVAEEVTDLFKADTGRPIKRETGMSKSAFGVEHEVTKAAHRRSESNVTATYGHLAETNQHARGGGVRVAGSRTPVSIGNQRTRGGSGTAGRHAARNFAQGVKAPRLVPKAGLAAGAALAGAGVAGAAVHHHRGKVGKSAFGVEHEVVKADPKKPSAGRVAAGTALGPYHAAVAGKKGRKLGAVGSSIGHSAAGGVIGSAALAGVTRGRGAGVGAALGGYSGNARAVYSNQAKGRYKAQA